MKVAPEVLQRVVFPDETRPDVLSLYIDSSAWSTLTGPGSVESFKATARGDADADGAFPLRLPIGPDRARVAGRRMLQVTPQSSVSLATYFNAFPASYWQRHTALASVRLRVLTEGDGSLIVYRSNARGVIQHVESRELHGATESGLDLPLDNFLDGGWYWFDLAAGPGGLLLARADWEAPEALDPVPHPQTATISITTMNRTSYCLALLETLSSDQEVLEIVDEIIVVDHGTEKLSAHPRFADVEGALAGALRVVEQDNVGGSGGFARGMLETLRAGRSDSILLLDDDVQVEPEGIRRAITFARFASKPTIVGGHMFDMYDKSRLHAYAESVRMSDFMWGPVSPPRHDFARSNLRQSAWVHRRFESLYNGWWMNLIPVSVLREIGLALPVFIKWDDAEFGVRAAAGGIPTVSLPGAAVWHVSWVDKDDSRDWQAFFHSRNRLVAAMLHSPHKRGGRVALSNFALDVRYLLSMDYYTAQLRFEAYRSVLAGPETLHREMKTRLPSIRALAGEHREATLIKDMSLFDNVKSPAEPGAYGIRQTSAPTGSRALRWLITQVIRHGLLPTRASARRSPQVHLPFSGAQWWVVPEYDSLIKTNAEGSGVTWHVREPRLFRSMLLTSIRLNLAYRRKWPRLSRRYRESISDLTSEETWSTTLGLTDVGG